MADQLSITIYQLPIYEGNLVLEKSIAFALRIIRLYRFLVDEKKEYVLSKELLVAGTNIGKHVQEAINGESRPTFIKEFGVARRKVSETEYWCCFCCGRS